MRYETVDGLQRANQGLREQSDRQVVALRRLSVVLSRKTLTPSERLTLDMAMMTAGVSVRMVAEIESGVLPWPR